MLNVLILSCQREKMPAGIEDKGSIDATLNGQPWPDYSRYNVQVVSFNLKNNGCEKVPVFSISVTNYKKNSEATEEGIGLTLIKKTGTYKVTYYDYNNYNSDYMCKEYISGKAVALFAFVFYDGIDTLPTTEYAVDTTKSNTLTVARIDTAKKEVEGSFDIRFVKRQKGSSPSRPDTISIRCTRFVAVQTN